MRLSAIPEAQTAEAVSQFNARFGEMERVLWRIRITAALAITAVIAGALAGCEPPGTGMPTSALLPLIRSVAIANQPGATSLGAPVPEGNDSCILSADGTNVTRAGTLDFRPGSQQITVTTFSSQADYDSQLATDGQVHGSAGYNSPPDRVVVIPASWRIDAPPPAAGC